MGTTLQHGIFLPAEGERNCYTGLASNWTILDGIIGGYSAHAANLTIHVTAADKEAWNGKADASALTAHTGNTTIHVTAADKEAWNGKADASALTAHTGNTTIHVTAADKEAWNGKADASALTAHTGDTTIHVTAADKEAWNGKADASALTAHTGNATIHVTAADKNNWDAVTTKANDADAVHKSGAETIAGLKTFSDTVTVPSINGINPGSLSLPDLNNGIDISGYITTPNAVSTYTPVVNGWVSIVLKSASGALGCFATQGDFANGHYSATALPNETTPCVMLSMPVIGGIAVNIYTKGANAYLYSAKFFPCQGNV